jgi:hypothetical protein
MSQPERIDQVVDVILGHSNPDSIESLTVGDLNQAYGRLHETSGAAPLLTVLSLEDRLIVRFPDLNSPILFVLIPEGVDPKAQLTAVPAWKLEWAGPTTRPQTFITFLKMEIVKNWRVLVVTATLVGLGLWAVATRDVLQAIIELGVTSLSIFLGIFVLFVIGQPGQLSTDFELFRKGRIHEFLRTDRHVTSMALLTLATGFIDLVVIRSSVEWTILGVSFDRIRIWGVLGTTLFLVLLIHLLRSIPQYYFRRLQVRIEREAMQWMLPSTRNSAIKPEGTRPPDARDQR